MIEGIKECSMNFNEEQQKIFVLSWQHLLNIVVRDMRNGYDERRRKEAKA
uniref:Phage protein n=1 Tax=Ascaris lumbricoides TaxID=6252 RepID=A0A0M3IKX0_ASCLU